MNTHTVRTADRMNMAGEPKSAPLFMQCISPLWHAISVVARRHGNPTKPELTLTPALITGVYPEHGQYFEMRQKGPLSLSVTDFRTKSVKKGPGFSS